MTMDDNKPVTDAKTVEDLQDEEEMRRVSLNNPQDPCGKEEDRFGK